ncbi:MAG: hypothetical protein U9R23_04015 [Candidatus Cloacimonadota bacterium]|nr:hypothetical protein [Candidatus Cloacimonadota bacterium]
MLTLHTTQTKTKIILLKDEFFQLIKKFKKIEPVEIIDEDPDYLTEEEMKARTEALKELEKGETVSADEYFRKRFPKENVNV